MSTKIEKKEQATKTATKKATQPQTLDFKQEQPTQEQTAPATPKIKWDKEEAAEVYQDFLFKRTKGPRNPAFIEQAWNKFCEVALNINPTAPRGKGVLDKQYYGIGRFTQFICTLDFPADPWAVESRLDEVGKDFAQFWSDMENVEDERLKNRVVLSTYIESAFFLNFIPSVKDLAERFVCLEDVKEHKNELPKAVLDKGLVKDLSEYEIKTEQDEKEIKAKATDLLLDGTFDNIKDALAHLQEQSTTGKVYDRDWIMYDLEVYDLFLSSTSKVKERVYFTLPA